MKRFLVLLLALPLIGATNISQTYTSGSAGISVTSANTAINFTDNRNGGTNASFSATTVTVISRAASANTCFVNFDQTTASATLDIPIVAGASLTRSRPASQAMAGIGVICASAQSATFDVIAQ